jgi:hypothetical protein
MHTKYVDEFFDDGSLMLSSFKRFASHKDEQRRDPSEGVGVRIFTGSDFSTVMATGRGDDAYILCGSALDTAAVRSCFVDADACLVIDDPLEFANAVSRSVPRFKGGASGHCIYMDDPLIERHSEAHTLENSMPKTFEDLRSLAETAGGVEEFLSRDRISPHKPSIDLFGFRPRQ